VFVFGNPPASFQVFFSFIGFDCVTTLAEELPNPQKDIPFGVISTLVIASILYTAASLVVTGMQPWNALDPDTPLASAFKRFVFSILCFRYMTIVAYVHFSRLL
jgi:cationic amino acid transporter 1